MEKPCYTRLYLTRTKWKIPRSSNTNRGSSNCSKVGQLRTNFD
jgi:hypothetical protein